MPLHKSMLAFLFAAAAFAPTPRTQRHTRRHFNFGNFGGGKKVDEEAAVKLVETVDDVGALPTEMEGLTPELDGLRKANALFNQGLISMDEIDEYADTLAAAKRKEVAEKERDAREAAEREARARERRARPPARRRAPSAASWASWAAARESHRTRRGSVPPARARERTLAPDSLMARLAWRCGLPPLGSASTGERGAPDSPIDVRTGGPGPRGRGRRGGGRGGRGRQGRRGRGATAPSSASGPSPSARASCVV